jgi:predicted transcriptional regulator
VKAWQTEKIKAGVRDAEQGRFASKEAVKAVIQKFIPNG